MDALLNTALGALVALVARDAAIGVARASGARVGRPRETDALARLPRRTRGAGADGVAGDPRDVVGDSDRIPAVEVGASQIIQEIAAGPPAARGAARARTHELDAADELLEADTGLRLAAVQFEVARDAAILTVAADRFCGALTDHDRWAMRRYAEQRGALTAVEAALVDAGAPRASTSDEIGRIDRDNQSRTVSGDRRAGGVHPPSNREPGDET